MPKQKSYDIQLTEEEIAAGVEILDGPPDEIISTDVSDSKIEQMAKGFILGSKAIGKRKDIRAHLEDKVTNRIGKKGKYLTDKLFELIDGIYIVQNTKGSDIKYYKVPPNLQAITYALDRVLGKPKTHVETSEDKKGIAVVESIIKNLAGGGTVETRRSVEIKQ